MAAFLLMVIVSLNYLKILNAFGGHDDGEYGHKCTVCDCFIKYENRDIKVPVEPYAEAIYPTLDQCLTLCRRDIQRCKSVVYGIVGGNAGIICELYNASGISDNLYNQWAMDYYEPALNWPCTIAFPQIYGVYLQEPEPGRARFRKEFATRPNPNYGQAFSFSQFPSIQVPQTQQYGNTPQYAQSQPQPAAPWQRRAAATS